MISVCGVIGSLLDGFAKLANSFEMFILGRYFMGGGLGCGMALASMFITEIAPVRVRGACGATQQILIGFGNAVSFVLTLSQVLGTERWWPIVVSVPPFVTSLMQTVVLMFYAHDSPRYLILAKSNMDKGFEALKFYQGKPGAEVRLDAIREEKRVMDERRKTGQVKQFKFVDVFRKPEIWRPLKIALLVSQV